MIESHYWRSELMDEIKWLKKHRVFRRWSEKQQVLYERRLMLTAFQVRSLLERPKVNDMARNTDMPAIRYKKVGERPFTVTGSGWPNERFDMENPEHVRLSALEVCNQIIHYYWMQTWAEGQEFSGMLVFSDYKRHKWAYQFDIEDLLQLFRVFADNSSAINGYESIWDEKKQDFIITKSW